MSRSIQPRIPRSAWSSCSLTARPFRTRTPPTYEQPAVNVSPRWDDLFSRDGALRVSERGTPMAAIGASPRRGQSAYGTWRRGQVDIAAASAGLCTSFTGAPMAQPSRSRTTRRTFAVACALTPKAPASRTASDCFPKIEAAETMLSRLEVFEQIAARGGGNGATHLREICPLRERLRGFKSSQSVQHRLTS